jgi:hypothetical protein
MNVIASSIAIAALAAALCAPLCANAQQNAQAQALGAEWTPIDPARLLNMRGGLQLPSGQLLSFGIKRLVYVNGELVASATLRIADISRITAEQAQALAAINNGLVVQVGEGNRIDTANTGGALVIQNTLDGQAITALTTLDVGVSTLGTLQELNTFNALQSALLNAPGAP